MTVRTITLILALSGSSLWGGPETQQSVTVEPGAKVMSFQVEGISVLQALLRLGQVTSTPIGIAQDDTVLSTTSIDLSMSNATLREVLDRILERVRGYRWEYSRESVVILVVPISPRPITKRLLNLTISHFSSPKLGIQGLGAWLWMYVRATLDPSQGTAGSILQNPDDPTFQIDEREATVEQILNKIAFLSKGAWVLSPLPRDTVDLSGSSPFTLIANR